MAGNALRVLLALSLATPALAQVDLGASAGFDGFYRAGSWLPIRVDISNDGPDIDGKLVVRWEALAFEQRVALPAPSRKSLEFYVHAGEPKRQLTLELLSSGNTVATETLSIQPLADEDRLVLRLPGAPASAGLVSGRIIVPVTIGELPRSWNGLESVQEILVGPDSIERMDESQKRSLDLWHMDGGRIVGGSEPAGPTLARRGDDTIILASVSNAFGTEREAGGSIYLAIAACLAVMLTILVRMRSVRSPWLVLAGLTAAVIIVSSGVRLWGTGWPDPDLEVRQFAVYRDFGAHDGVQVASDGILVSGGQGVFRFRAPPELFFEAFAGPSSPRHLFYEDRTFELEQSLGFGEALRYSLAGFVDESLVDVEAVGSILRIGNPDGWELSECFVVEEEGFFAVPVPQQERPVEFDVGGVEPHDTFFENPTTGHRMLTRLLSEEESAPYVACLSERDPSLTVDSGVVRGSQTTLLIQHYLRSEPNDQTPK